MKLIFHFQPWVKHQTSGSWIQHINKQNICCENHGRHHSHPTLQMLPTSRDQISGTPEKSISHLPKKWARLDTNSFQTYVEPCRFGFPTAFFVLMRSIVGFFLFSPESTVHDGLWLSKIFLPAWSIVLLSLKFENKSLLVKHTVFIGWNQTNMMCEEHVCDEWVGRSLKKCLSSELKLSGLSVQTFKNSSTCSQK